MRGFALAGLAACTAIMAASCDASHMGGEDTATTTLVVPATTLGPAATTTTIIVDGFYTVQFHLVDAVTLGALQFAVDYAAAPAAFAGKADQANCADRTGSLTSFYDNDAESILTAGFITLVGFTGPMLIAECTLTPAIDVPQPSDFVMSVVDAAAPDLTPIVPPPTITVVIVSR